MNKYHMPEVRIIAAVLLAKKASQYIHQVKDTSGRDMMGEEKVREVASVYQKAWQPYCETVLGGLNDILELSFRKNIIDVYIAPWFTAFSTPLVVGVHYDPERFVQVLAHELTHVLLTDNNEIPYHSIDYVTHRKRLYGSDLSPSTLAHIEVHAILEELYTSYLKKEEWLRADKATCQLFTDYKIAWDYVDEHGYKTIITKLKKSYNQLEKK